MQPNLEDPFAAVILQDFHAYTTIPGFPETTCQISKGAFLSVTGTESVLSCYARNYLSVACTIQPTVPKSPQPFLSLDERDETNAFHASRRSIALCPRVELVGHVDRSVGLFYRMRKHGGVSWSPVAMKPVSPVTRDIPPKSNGRVTVIPPLLKFHRKD